MSPLLYRLSYAAMSRVYRLLQEITLSGSLLLCPPISLALDFIVSELSRSLLLTQCHAVRCGAPVAATSLLFVDMVLGRRQEIRYRRFLFPVSRVNSIVLLIVPVFLLHVPALPEHRMVGELFFLCGANEGFKLG